MSDERLWEDAGSIFRPSYSSTWLNCAGALRASMGRRDNAGYDAAVGTVFHMLMSDWLKSDERPSHWLGQVIDIEKEDGSEIFHVTVDEEMFEEGEKCVTYSRQFEGEQFIETRTDISSITPIPNQGGTSDLAYLSLGKLIIVDWKYGRGVQVFAEQNEQLLCYAWGWFAKYDDKYHFEEIEIHIVQPRLGHFDSWTIARDELIEWADNAKVRAAEAWKRNADRTPSPKACFWCKARVDCAAMEDLRQRIVDQTFDGFDEPVSTSLTIEGAQKLQTLAPQAPKLPDPMRLPTDRLAEIIRYRKLMEAWFKQIHDELIERAANSEEERAILAEYGWKLVEGRTKRRWKDEAVAAEKLSSLGVSESELWETKLRSPNQVEKLLRHVGVKGALVKKFLATLAGKPPGKPTLAPTGDARLALPNVVDDTFDDQDGAAL